MPRRARIRMANIPLHVVQRGNNRSPCFLSTGDRAVYLNHLGELAELFECAIHAYVLMTNHVHLLVTPTRADGVSLMMKHLGQRYVQYVNRIHSRTGSLWEGRYRSSFIDSDRYLFCCYRYIELNPVRAGLVRHPRDYPWSSHQTNAEGCHSNIIRPHPQFLLLGNDDRQRREAYRSLFATEMQPAEINEIRKLTNGGFAIGSEAFLRRVELETGRRAAPAPRGRRPRTALE